MAREHMAIAMLRLQQDISKNHRIGIASYSSQNPVDVPMTEFTQLVAILTATQVPQLNYRTGRSR
jgi:hypothetical protein